MQDGLELFFFKNDQTPEKQIQYQHQENSRHKNTDCSSKDCQMKKFLELYLSK